MPLLLYIPLYDLSVSAADRVEGGTGMIIP